MRHLLLFFCCACYSLLSAQQDTSLLLNPERLQEKDIFKPTFGLKPTVSISGTRSPETLEELPFTIWVIKAEDILRYGFVTLGDVLRAAPGIRVSQPGNALEGETFLMRGLAGNQYVKILINDVPIKPTQTIGMPIGAQLPIRQAERIEVMYGPASGIYGDEACAGVVNIILKESERPLYTQADLSVGNFGYNSLDLMFGGKLGKDKRIFRFNIYGSNTIKQWYNTKQLFTEGYLDMGQYVPFGFDYQLYLNNPHFTSNGASNYAVASTLSHESRLLGANATWRGLQINYNRMLRTDHTGLGLNPVAISWGNPGNRLSERLDVLTFAFKTKKKKRDSHHSFSFVNYNIDNNSNATYLYHRLIKDVYSMTNRQQRLDQALMDTLSNRYASGPRHSNSKDFNARWETRVQVALTPRLYWHIMASAQASIGTPYATYLKPDRRGQFGGGDVFFSGPYQVNYFGGSDLNLSSQLEWRGKRLYLLGALLGNISNAPGVDGIPFVAPRFAVLYKIDSNWSVRTNGGIGFRSSGNFFYGANSFLVNLSRDTMGQYNHSVFGRESVRNVELGVRYKKGFFAEAYAYVQTAHNLVRPATPFVLPTTDPNAPSVLTGYASSRGLSQSLWGIQGIFRSENQKITKVGNKQKAQLNARVEFYILYTQGREYLANGATWQTEVFNLPKWHRQFRLFSRLNKVEVMFATNWQSSVLSKSVAYKQFYELSALPERLGQYRSWDMMTRFYLSKYFVVYCHLQNAFNRQVTGLDATGTPDDLVPTIQQGRLLRFGVNYNMN